MFDSATVSYFSGRANAIAMLYIDIVLTLLASFLETPSRIAR